MSDLEKVKRNPSHLAYVEDQTERMCHEAVSRNGLTLYYAKFKTDEINQIAIKQNPNAINFVDEQTEDLCNLAVSEDGLAIQHIDKKTPQLCLRSVRQNGGALNFIPKNMWTEELLIEAIKQDPTVLQLIDDQTEEMCMIAIAINPETIAYVKNHTADIIKKIINSPGPGGVCTAFIDFKKFKIGSIYDVETGDIYMIDPTQPITNNTPFSSDQRKLVYFKDLRKDKVMYINNAVSIQDEIEKYIRQRYGNKCLVKAMSYFSTDETLNKIKDDMTFDEGVFFIKHSDNSYDMYKKTTTYEKGWWYSKTHIPTIEKIREYGVIEEE